MVEQEERTRITQSGKNLLVLIPNCTRSQLITYTKNKPMLIVKSPESSISQRTIYSNKKQLFKGYWLGARKVRELTKVMAAVLSWYLNKMSYFSYIEILESRTELFKLINGDVFYSFLLLNFFQRKT